MASTHSSQRNLAVGLTTLAGIVGLAVLMLVFGYVPQLTRDVYTVQIRMERSGGLNPDAQVTLAGIEVGNVTEVRFADGGPAAGVVVLAEIESAYRIPEGSQVRVTRPLLGGGSIAHIHPPALHGTQPATLASLPTDGTAVLTGREASMLPELEEPLESFTAITADFSDLADEWKKVGGNLNDLLAGRELAAVDAGDAVANLSTLVQRIDARVAEARQIMAGVQDLVGDQEMRDDIRATIRNAADVSDAVGDTVRTARETLAETRENIDDLKKRIVVVADDLSAAIGDARAVLRQAREGEGTVGELLNNPQLIDNLNDASTRLQKLLDESRLLIQKWKSEGLPVQF